MSEFTISVTDGTSCKNYDEVRTFIFNGLREQDIVKASWLNALREREAEYPTGIALDGYAVAIPHCASENANRPAVFIVRVPEAVEVDEADGDGKLWVNLFISLVVTDPADQLQMLKSLFNHLQIEDFYQKLLSLPAMEAEALFISTIIQ